MNNDVVEVMVAERRHICAEVMSKADQKHGARVLMETPVITSVGCGLTFAVEEKGLCYRSPDLSDSAQIKFVTFLTHDDLVAWCTSHGLPCDSAVRVNDGGQASVPAFMKALSQRRDDLTEKSFSQLLDDFRETVTINHGNRAHSEVLGDCLEGLVLTCTLGDGKSFTKKYKFPNYTCRTMALRSALSNFTLEKDASGKSKIVGQEAIKSFKEFSERWCVTTEGKAYWFRFLQAAAHALAKDLVGWKEGGEVAAHILAADYCTQNTEWGEWVPTFAV